MKEFTAEIAEERGPFDFWTMDPFLCGEFFDFAIRVDSQLIFFPLRSLRPLR